TDYTSVQDMLDDYSALGRNLFLHPQYGALAVYSTIGFADYNGFSVSLRQRLSRDVAWDFNYTFSHSFDTGSALESGGSIYQAEGGGIIRNPLNVRGARASSGFDVRHNINANCAIGLPFGKAKKFFGNSNSVLDAVIGGWSLTGVARFNSGLPVSPGETGLWSTNWNLTSPSTPLTSLKTGSNKNISGSGTATLNGRPNLFANPDAAYKSIRNSRPGEEVGRNALRLPGYAGLDAGL